MRESPAVTAKRRGRRFPTDTFRWRISPPNRDSADDGEEPERLTLAISVPPEAVS